MAPTVNADVAPQRPTQLNILLTVEIKERQQADVLKKKTTYKGYVSQSINFIQSLKSSNSTIRDFVEAH